MDSATIVYIVIEVLIAVLAVIGNSLVCYVVIKSKKLREKSMFIFVTSLAVVDFLVGAVGGPFAILTKLGLPHNSPYLCIIMLTFIIILTNTSIYNLMAISTERYLAIRHPHVHFSKLTPRVSRRIAAVARLVAVLLGMIPLGWNDLKKSQDNIRPMNSTQDTTSKLLQDNIHECHFIEVDDLLK